MYNEGFSLTDISNDVKVTVRGVNKIINRLLKYGSFRGLAFMQEKHRTDFCLKGYVTEINVINIGD